MCVGIVVGPKPRAPATSERSRRDSSRAERRRTRPGDTEQTDRGAARRVKLATLRKSKRKPAQDRRQRGSPEELGAMAPALTQATPHQRCCPAGNGPSSPAGPLALLHHPAVSPRARRKPVWPDDGPKRTRKCSGARASSVTLNSERSTNSYEARPRHSDTELSECNEELDGAETLDPAPLANGSPAAEGDGDGDGAMGLEPTASGDRMEMDAPPLAAESPRKASELAEVGIDVDPATVDAILDVMTGIDVEHMELALPEMDEAPGAESGPPEPAGRLPPVDKEAEVERRLAEVRSRQLAIETRCQTLLKRAGRVQSRHVGRHVADQVAHFVAYAKETLAIGAKGRPGHHGANGANLYGWAEDGRLPTREEVRNIPTATLVNLVSRLQAPPVSYLSNRRYFGLPAKSGGQQGTHHHHHQQRPGAQLSSQVAESIEEVAGLWEAQLRYLQRHDDPDATESSSGGESDDETIDPAPAPVETTDPASSSVHPLPAVKPVSTYQRAAWRWARDRAAVAARWSWLQAQVSDLEYRIRQHTDVYRQLRAAKGAVHFASADGVPRPSTSSACSPTKQAEADDSDAEACCSSSRTRPLASGGQSASAFRRRRLIRATQAQSGRKASRLASSTVRCCCVMSRICNPCVLCNGKNNYLLPVDPDGMTVRERVALTDRGFHPVLSLDQDIPLGAHVDSLLKSGDWKPPPPPVSSTSQAASGRPSLASRRSSSKLQPDDDAGSVASGHSVKRKVPPNGTGKRKKGADEESAVSLKERRKSLTKRRKKHLPSTDALDEDSQSYPSSPFGDGSAPATPGRPGLASRGSGLQDMLRRRTSYDIDNIVIPYSMAATTRVEKLQYKEIQTPKWRIVDGVPSHKHEASSSEDAEDVSEESIQARHDRSEVEERKKFMSYLKQPAGVTRGRRRFDQIDRMDSRAEHSSGANTPDPMSPSCQLASGSKAADNEAVEGEEGGGQAPGAEADGLAPTTPTPVSALVAAAVKERRRTASLTKRDSISRFIHEDNSGMSWDVDELIRSVAPYEPRQFPLTEALYQQLIDEMPGSDGEEELIGGIVIEARPKREARSSESAPVPSAPTSAHQPAGATPTTTTSSVDDEPVPFMSESSGSPPPEELDVDEDDPDWEASSQSSVTRAAAKRR